jgi:hypothetical protein
MLLKLPNKLEY